MYKILLVDDSPTIVQLLKKGFESDDYAVLTTDNGADALTIIRKEIPDLVVLDLMLPKLDGFHVCAMLKKDAKLSKIKVLMLTGRIDEGSRKLADECGADKYVTKDTGPQEIIAIAIKLLSS